MNVFKGLATVLTTDRLGGEGRNRDECTDPTERCFQHLAYSLKLGYSQLVVSKTILIWKARRHAQGSRGQPGICLEITDVLSSLPQGWILA